MKRTETNQTHRSEEINWTEREKELAERYKIKPERVRRLFVFAENWAEKTLESEAYYEKLEAAANAKPERERESETESAVDDVSVVQSPDEAEVTEEQKPERITYGFDPKEQVQAYKVFEQWLENRTLDEKRTALALSMLLSKQQYLPNERIGDKMYKQWRDEVLAVSNLDQLPLKGVPGNEAFSQGYLMAMIVMDG